MTDPKTSLEHSGIVSTTEIRLLCKQILTLMCHRTPGFSSEEGTIERAGRSLTLDFLEMVCGHFGIQILDETHMPKNARHFLRVQFQHGYVVPDVLGAEERAIQAITQDLRDMGCTADFIDVREAPTGTWAEVPDFLRKNLYPKPESNQ